MIRLRCSRGEALIGGLPIFSLIPLPNSLAISNHQLEIQKKKLGGGGNSRKKN